MKSKAEPEIYSQIHKLGPPPFPPLQVFSSSLAKSVCEHFFFFLSFFIFFFLVGQNVCSHNENVQTCKIVVMYWKLYLKEKMFTGKDFTSGSRLNSFSCWTFLVTSGFYRFTNGNGIVFGKGKYQQYPVLFHWLGIWRVILFYTSLWSQGIWTWAEEMWGPSWMISITFKPTLRQSPSGNIKPSPVICLKIDKQSNSWKIMWWW